MLEIKLKEHNLYHLIEGEVRAIVDHIREHVGEGLTIGGVWCLLEDVLKRAVTIVDRIEGDGQDKKEIAILLVEDLYEAEIKPLNLPWVPDAVEGFVDKTIGEAIRPTMSWLFDREKA